MSTAHSFQQKCDLLGALMELSKATVQDIQLELIRRSNWNAFNGQRIFDGLHQHKNLWESVMLDTRERLKLIKLRDLVDNRWNTDILYILASNETNAEKLVDLCWQWSADEARYYNAKTTSDTLHRGLLVSQASAAGLHSTVHAIGDRAVHDVLDVYDIVRDQEAKRGEARSSRRHRIEHVQLIHPDDKHRLAQLDIIASMQPMHATSDYEMSDRYWGARSKWAYNARLQIDQGVKYAFGSDSPIEPFEPFKSIYAAVTRRRADGSPGVNGWYPELRVTVDEALHGYTTGPAYAAGTEDHTGKLAAGYLADLIVIDRDPYQIPPDDLLNVKVQATMVDGLWRFGGM